MSIGNCPRCGAQTDDENDLCYQCALRRIVIELDAHAEYDPNYPEHYDPCEVGGHAWGLDELNRVQCGRCGERQRSY